MALEASANRHFFVPGPPHHHPPPFPDQPLLRATQRHSPFPPTRVHSASSGSVKSERYSPPHSDPSLPTLPDFTFHSSPQPSSTGPVKVSNPTLLPLSGDHYRQPLRFGMTPPHSNHASDGWNFKRPHTVPVHGPGISIDMGDMSYTDEYDDGDDLADLPAPSNSSSSQGGQAEKTIRRRSSKACTFLGPSRKRGPPKGYIDAIEARLHQTEALLGILLALEADQPTGEVVDRNQVQETLERGRSLTSVLATLRKDTLAKEILNRVDLSPYGVRGRKTGKTKPRPNAHTQAGNSGGVDLQTTHCPGSPPVLTRAGEGSTGVGSVVDSCDTEGEEDVLDAVGQLSLNEEEQIRYHGKASGLYLLGINAKAEARNEGGIWRFPKARVWPPLPQPPTSPTTSVNASVDHATSPSHGTDSAKLRPSATHANDMDIDLPDPSVQEHLLELYFTYVHASFPIVHKTAFLEAHRRMQGKDTSPVLDGQERSNYRPSQSPFDENARCISPLLLLSMFAIVARYSTTFSPLPSASPSSPSSPQHPKHTMMWSAGDDYLSRAKILLDQTYASPRPCTVQALLLLGYRELGIGAMAQAWMYTGMAVRMAQDLGMHRAADGWVRAGLGKLFSNREIQERRRIWWGCVALDVYISTYIGRPLAIVGKDYNTHLPSVDEADEMELWTTHASLPPDIHGHGYRPENEAVVPIPGRVLSCFTASATLSTILANIVQSIYCINSSSRYTDAVRLEGALDKWYLDLPEHLRLEIRHDTSGNWIVPAGKNSPLPHVLTLHMQYWCTTLLLHRPFIRQVYMGNKKTTESTSDIESRSVSQKNYELCVKAANHIASIVSFYREKYCLQRAPMFLCFYAFTAGIMHITNLSLCPNDPQASLGLTRCIEALEDMEIVWPSAARACELLRTCNPLSHAASQPRTQYSASPLSRKRSAEQLAQTGGSKYERSPSAHVPTLPRNENPVMPSHPPYAEAWRSTQYGTSTEEGNVTQHQDNFPQAAAIPSGQASSFFPWASDGVGGPYVPYGAASVLPQTYSSGMIDERRQPQSVAPSHHGQGRLPGHSNEGEQGYEQVSGARYPQYWSDYTPFGQMGLMYTQSEGRHPNPSHTPQVEMYLDGQYGGIYSE
ncbi:hypothetical protein ID866_2692 [Astraeus odoratus]|nr:hypothetical protein ID866_2692 [Astraeus odoratus]